MSNIAGGVSGAIQGAQVGGQLGGGWGAIIGGVGGALLGGLGTDPAKAQLESIRKYNAEVTKYTNQSIFDLQRQRVTERMRTSQALASYQDNSKAALSTLKAQYAATDVVGSSAKALGMTIDFQTDQAMAQEWFNFDVGIDNYNTNVRSIVNQGISKLSNNIGKQPQSAGTGALQTALSMYSQYKDGVGKSTGTGGFSAGLQFGDSPLGVNGGNISSGNWSGVNLGI